MVVTELTQPHIQAEAAEEPVVMEVMLLLQLVVLLVLVLQTHLEQGQM